MTCPRCSNPVMARPGQPHECPKWYLAPHALDGWARVERYRKESKR